MDDMELMLQKMLEQRKELFSKATIKPICNNFFRQERTIKSRDFVVLKTVIFLPDNKVEQHPTILFRSCYPHQKDFLELMGQEYAKRGFAFVYQWCRGTGGSEGVWEPNINERNDGLDTLEWLSKESFVESIGYMGDSYLALTGWCMADAVPSKVKTMFLGVYGTDRYVSAYKSGLFRQDILTSWAMGNAGVEITANQMESYSFMPQTEVDERLWGVRLNWYRDWITNTQKTDPYWQEGFWKTLKEIPSKVKIPLFIKEGWYDHHLGSALVAYEDLSEESKQHSTLQIGPWNHGYMPAVSHQSLDNLIDDSVETPLNWFYKILVKREKPEAKILNYVIGADSWQEFKAYPKSDNKYKELFLTGNRKIINNNSEVESTIKYTYDPNNPLMAYGAESLFANMDKVGSLVQENFDDREDVISFSSDPLKESLHIVGKIKLKLTVSSTAEDTAFYGKLMEVFADGTAVNIRGSITTLAFRNGSEKRLEYTPNTKEEIEIDMWDINWQTQPGSSLRLDVSSSHFPEYSVHSNNRGVWSKQTKNIIAEQSLYFGSDNKAEIILPLCE